MNEYTDRVLVMPSPVLVVKLKSVIYRLFKMSLRREIATLTCLDDGRIHVACNVDDIDRLPGRIYAHYDEENICTSDASKNKEYFTIPAEQGPQVFAWLQEKTFEGSPYGFAISLYSED